MSDPSPFSIITVNYNNAQVLIEVLDKTLKLLSDRFYEVIVIDNCSSDTSFQLLSEYYNNLTSVKVFRAPRNGGFGYGCNYGARLATNATLWFLNSDAWANEVDQLDQLLLFVSQPSIGIVGTGVFGLDGQPAAQGGSDMSFSYFLAAALRPGKFVRGLPEPIRRFILRAAGHFPGAIGRYSTGFQHFARTEPYSSPGVGGASFFISRSTFWNVEGFDEDFFLYDEDGDLCLRLIKNGFSNWVFPKVSVQLYISSTTSKLPSLELKRIKKQSRVRFIEKHFKGLRRISLVALTKLTWRLL